MKKILIICALFMGLNVQARPEVTPKDILTAIIDEGGLISSLASPEKPSPALLEMLRNKLDYLLPELAGAILEQRFSWRDAPVRTQDFNQIGTNPVSGLKRSLGISRRSVWKDINKEHPIIVSEQNTRNHDPRLRLESLLPKGVKAKDVAFRPEDRQENGHDFRDHRFRMGAGDVSDVQMAMICRAFLLLDFFYGDKGKVKTEVELHRFWTRKKQIGFTVTISAKKTGDDAFSISFPLIMSWTTIPRGLKQKLGIDRAPERTEYSDFSLKETFDIELRSVAFIRDEAKKMKEVLKKRGLNGSQAFEANWKKRRGEFQAAIERGDNDLFHVRKEDVQLIRDMLRDVRGFNKLSMVQMVNKNIFPKLNPNNPEEKGLLDNPILVLYAYGKARGLRGF